MRQLILHRISQDVCLYISCFRNAVKICACSYAMLHHRRLRMLIRHAMLHVDLLADSKHHVCFARFPNFLYMYHTCYTSDQVSFLITARVQIMAESSESMLERTKRLARLRKQRQRQRDKEDTGTKRPRFYARREPDTK